MLRLGFKPVTIEWQAQMDSLSYGDRNQFWIIWMQKKRPKTFN